MSMNIAASRLLIEKASALKDNDMPYSKEAAQAKLFASEACMNITTKAIQQKHIRFRGLLLKKQER